MCKCVRVNNVKLDDDDDSRRKEMLAPRSLAHPISECLDQSIKYYHYHHSTFNICFKIQESPAQKSQ